MSCACNGCFEGLPGCSRAAQLDSALEYFNLVSLDGILSPLGMQISKLPSNLGDDLDHFLDHVARVHASARAPDEPRNHLANGRALGEVDLIVEPPEGVLRHRLVEAREIGSRIDGLHLNAEGLEFRLHRFGNRLHRVLGGGVRCESRRAQEAADG
jgi:hypothetical protein